MTISYDRFNEYQIQNVTDWKIEDSRNHNNVFLDIVFPGLEGNP